MPELVLKPTAGRASGAALRLLGDDRLSQRAAGGDADAFTAIVERYHQSLYRYCRGLLASPEDARDAVQATLLSAWQALKDEGREIALRPWLYRIAHNESVTLLRRRRTHAPLEEAALLAGDGVGPRPEVRERLRQLVADMRELAEGQRGALLMRELSGLRYEEVAEALGTSQAAAKQAVYDSRRALQDFEAGRAMDCDEVTRAISGGDGRMLRGRRMRAHLRDCRECHDFRAAISRRRQDLRALAPPLSPAGAAALLEATLASTGGAMTGGGGGLGALAAVGKLTGGSLAAKGLATGAATLALGAGAVELSSSGSDRAGRSPGGAVVPRQADVGAAAPAAAGLVAGTRRERAGPADERDGLAPGRADRPALDGGKHRRVARRGEPATGGAPVGADGFDPPARGKSAPVRRSAAPPVPSRPRAGAPPTTAPAERPPAEFTPPQPPVETREQVEAPSVEAPAGAPPAGAPELPAAPPSR